MDATNRITFTDYLDQMGIDLELKSVLISIKEAVKKIAKVVATAEGGKAGTKNVYGEEQLALDVLSDRIFMESLKENPHIGLIASEEQDTEKKIGEGAYGVAYDPLDGSSLVDVNLSVGTIFGIYKTNTFIGRKGDEMLAAGFALYGPRTTLMLGYKDRVMEFVLQDNKFFLSRKDLKVGSGKMFAPGNLRATLSRPDYINLMLYWMKEQYTLRYSGGMVPDINQILIKGKGIFAYPGYPEKPDGKLRLLFECAPMSYLMERADGASSDGKMRILDKVVTKVDQRTPILIGSKEEVARACDFLKDF